MRKKKAPTAMAGGEGADEKVITDNYISHRHSRQTIHSCVNNSIGRWAKGSGRWSR